MKKQFNLPKDFRILITRIGHRMERKSSAIRKHTLFIPTKNATQIFGLLMLTRNKPSKYFIGMVIALAIPHFPRMVFRLGFLLIVLMVDSILNRSSRQQAQQVKSRH